jgi:hypothetical protein
MPDEALITEIENVFAEIIDLGGQSEDSKIVPNLTVQDASPTNLDGWLIVSDDRDGDNILARKVGSVVYADNDLVNVMFLKGGEAIAFQQGSESGNNGIWEIVPSTSTDIFYDKGNVGIGKSIAPDAALEILDTAQAQLRLTHTEDTKFANFTLDTNHDLTITPSSTGQVILQPTTDSTDFFQVLDADGGDSVFNVDSTNERVTAGASGDANSTAKFNVISDGSDLTQTVSRYQNDGTGAGILFQKSRGTLATPLAVNSGDFSAGFESKIYNGSAFTTNALISFKSQGTISASSSPGQIDLWTTPVSSTSASVRMTILNDGSVGVATTAPKHPLQIFGTLKVGGHAGEQTGTIALGNDATTTLNVGIFRTATGGGLGSGNYLGLGGFGGIRFTASNTQIGSQTEWMRIETSGLIGINGVTSPSTELDIGAGAIEFDEMTAPGAGAANTARLFVQDNGAGKTQLAVRFNTGAIQILATEP